MRYIHGGRAAQQLARSVAPKMADDFANWPRELEPYVGKRVRFRTTAGEEVEGVVVGWTARHSTGARLEVEGHGLVWVGDVEVVEE